MYDWFKKTKTNFHESVFLKFYINFERKKLIQKIEQRTTHMIKEGAIQEVIRCNKAKIKKNHSAKKVIGIEEITKFLDNQIKLEHAKELIAIKTRQYAKRQATWAKSRMLTWTKIDPRELLSVIKKENKSPLKLDQLI